MRPTVFLPEPIAACGISILEKEHDCIAPWREGRMLSKPQEVDMLREADAVIVRLLKITASELKHCSNLKVIAKHGVGVDNIDCKVATEHGIPVIFTPTANANAVAEHTIGLMLSLARNVCGASQALRGGSFADRSSFVGIELYGKTLGIVGLGRIGSRVAEIAAAGLGMNVQAYDPYREPGEYRGPADLNKSLNTVLAVADFLTLHTPLSKDTEYLIDDECISMIKPGCRIVNTSRGVVVDEQALIHALKDGRLAGAALDVFEEEPVPGDHPLCGTPNLLLTPHIAGQTQESMDQMATDCARGIIDVLQGRKPVDLVNPEVMS